VSGVVAYLNEVPIPGDNGLGGDLAGGPGLLFDLENVQVLKGPQGTLFGRNSVGGALLLQSRRPSNEFAGHIEAGYGNYNDRAIDAALNVPVVSDKLLVRLAFIGEKRDGFTYVASDPLHPNGFHADNRDFWAVRGTVRFKPIESLTNDTIATYQTFRSNGSGLILTAVRPDGIFAGLLTPLLAEQQRLGVRSMQALDAPIFSGGTNLALDNITTLDLSDTIKLKNIFGYNRVSHTYVDDFDGTTYPIVEVPSWIVWRHSQQYSDELQLSGASFSNQLQWVMGGFYLNHREPGLELAPRQLFFTPSDVLVGEKDWTAAVYAQGTYDLSSLVQHLKFTAGVRGTRDYSESRARGSFGAICPGNPVYPASAVRLCGSDTEIDTDARSDALTWTLGLDYQLTPDMLLYITSRRGYRAGGGNAPRTPGERLPPFGPEYVVDVELGLKSDFHVSEMPVRLNLAVFHDNNSGVQVPQTVTSPAFGVAGITSNAADAEVWGGELEVSAKLLRSLQVGAYLDLLSYKYKNFAAGVESADQQLLKEEETIAKPRTKYGINATYSLPLPASVGSMSLSGAWAWQSSTATSALADAGDYFQPGGKISAYGLLNLNADWHSIFGRPLDISLFCTNVLNKTYQIGGSSGYFGSLGLVTAMYGEPRMYGARLRFRFGGEAGE
jgi:iron complex outermembrane receptor protein